MSTSDLSNIDVLRVQLDECFSPSRNTFCLSKNRLAIETLPSPIVEEVDVKKYDRLFALDNSASNSNYSNCKDFTDVTLMKNERRSKKQHDKQANFLLTAGDLNVVNNISWKFNKDPWITLVMCMNQFQPTVSVSQPRSSQLNDDTSLPTYKRLLKKVYSQLSNLLF